MLNTELQNTVAASMSSDELIKEVLTVLESDKAFDSDSDAGLDLIQKFRELTLRGQQSPRDIAMRLLFQYCSSIHVMCDQYEHSAHNLEIPNVLN